MPQPESKTMLRDVYRNLCRAEALVRKGEWAAADDCYASALARDKSPASRLAFATSLAEREQYHDALCQLTAALDLALIAGDREALSVIYHNLAAIYRELGDNDLAQRFQRRSIQQLDDCGSDELLGLANDAWLSNQRKVAQRLAESAADLGDPAGPASESEAMSGIACAMNGGDVREGIRCLLRVYRRHRAQASHRMMGTDLLNLSILFGIMGRSQGEIALVQEAIRCFDRASARVSSHRARRVLEVLNRVQSLQSFDASRN